MKKEEREDIYIIIILWNDWVPDNYFIYIYLGHADMESSCLIMMKGEVEVDV